MDGKIQKITVIGCSGSGKSTLSKYLGEKIGVEPVDLDTLRFVEGFDSEKRSSEDFIDDVKKISNKEKWVVEGVYYKYGIEDVLWAKSDLVIWLDLPLWIIWYRTFNRSVKRLIHKKTKPSGKPVSWKTEFGKDGLMRVLHKIHKAIRKHYPPLLEKLDSETEIIHVKSNRDSKNLQLEF